LGLITKENRLSNEEIIRIINENLGMKWTIENIKIINGKTYLDLIDDEGYQYSKIYIHNIKKYHSVSKFHKSNPYTKQNINNYCKINNLSIRLNGEYKGTDIKLVWECLECNNTFKRKWPDVYQGIVSCSNCADGLSYPEKFGLSLFNQLKNIYEINNYDYQYSPDWIKPKRYDFYFELNIGKYILEMDGSWHKKDNKMSKQTKEKSKEIDNYKDIKAKEHGIGIIRIDCDKSELEYIKYNILNSQLNKLFDLTKIDWLKCHEYACKSLVKEVCDLWNIGVRNTLEISKITNINRKTATRYLKQGAELKWCGYDAKEELKKNMKQTNEKKKKRSVIQLDLNGKYIAEFESIADIKKLIKINNSSISLCCNGKQRTSYGFRWMYKEDWEKCNDNIMSYKRISWNIKKIIQLSLNNEYISEFESATEAGRQLGINNSHITGCCKGSKKTAGGYKWTYK